MKNNRIYLFLSLNWQKKIGVISGPVILSYKLLYFELLENRNLNFACFYNIY